MKRRLLKEADILPSRSYTKAYASTALRGTEERRPWQLSEVILSAARARHTLLDVGCGTSQKLLPLAPHFECIIAVDPSEDMRACSRETFRRQTVRNVKICAGTWQALPVHNASVDVLTSMLAGVHIDEAYRVVKPDGVFVFECIGARDHADIKAGFAADIEGPRGQHMQFDETEFTAFIYKTLARRFPDVTLQEGSWITHYTREGLLALLENSPIVRHFDALRDAAEFTALLQKLDTPAGFASRQSRILAVCHKTAS